MNGLTLRAVAAALVAAVQPSPSTAAAADAHQEAKSALHFYGRGYARAALDATASPALHRVGAPRTVPLPAGEMQVQREGDEGQVLVRVLKLSRADLPDLGLQTGVTPVEALIREYGQPESRDAQHLVYRGVAEICTDHLVFHIGRGVLQGIEWDWCHD